MAETKTTGPTTADMYRVFCLILEESKKQTATLEHVLGLLETQGPGGGAVNVRKVASDADLVGRYGDPEVKAKSPRDWSGDSMTGKRFSECPAEYLDLVADRLDYFAEQNSASENDDDKKKAKFNRLDAARARGWAARIRAGYVAPVKAAEPSAAVNPFADDQIPF